MAALLLLGIDGGASRCRARLRDGSGTLLGEGNADPANVFNDIDQARSSIMAAATGALRAAGLSREDIARCRAGIGLAGAGSTDLQSRLLEGWNPFASIRLSSDAYIGWLGAHGGADGAVIILGTGSVCYGQAGSRTLTLGGWGPDISDEASAAAIGREALRRSVWAWDGRIAATPLAENLLGMFGGAPDLMVQAARTATAADYGAYAPLVFQFAEAQDTLAEAILRDAASHVSVMIQRLASAGFERISLLGGIAAQMRPWLCSSTASRLSEPLGDAAEGAIALARR